MADIKSIAEGTFVLGDTNGLTFEAGSGITVSQPSEGTVRIANDETVLWSTNSPAALTTFTLSEEASNFEFVDFHFRLAQSMPVDYVLRFIGSTNWVSLVGFVNGDITIWVSSTMFGTSDHKIFNRYQYKWNLGIDQGRETGDIIRILKVVGINRISGGNA